jgi:hypothetical protein
MNNNNTTPATPTTFPFSVGDVLTLERETIYYQNSQSFKITTRTIKSIIVDADGKAAAVKFKESANTYELVLHYQGGAKVKGNKSRYDVNLLNGNSFAWHNINIMELV